jgi:Flp pilus assembly protein TadG
MKLLHRKRRTRRGVALVEFAIVLPLLILLLIGIWEVGRVIEVQQSVQNAAREGGRQTSTAKRTVSQVTQSVKDYLARAGFVTTNVTVTITNLTNAARSDPTTANQLDKFQVVVTMPFDDARLITQKWFTNGRILSAKVVWLSMRDIPLAINKTIPPE